MPVALHLSGDIWIEISAGCLRNNCVPKYSKIRGTEMTQLVVCNSSRFSVEELEALGAQEADSLADVASKCQVIITMLPNSPQVREVCLGENGILEMAGAGAVVIDMSSIDLIESKAIDGTLSVMADGEKEDFDKYYDLLMAIAGSVVYVGPLGSGNVAKLANQVIVR